MNSSRISRTEQLVPSVWRMLWVDFPSFICTALPVVVLGLGTVLTLFGNVPGILGRESLGADDLHYFLIFGGLILVLCIPLLMLRIKYLRGLLSCGHEQTGTIIWARQASNGSWLRFRYRFNGRTYARSLRTHRALIKELYF